jgi:hypothetical protein
MRRANTPTGSKFTVRGQVYLQTGAFYHTMGNDREVRVLELRTACPECGDSFQATASMRQISTRQLVRRLPGLSRAAFRAGQDCGSIARAKVSSKDRPWPEGSKGAVARREGEMTHLCATAACYPASSLGYRRPLAIRSQLICQHLLSRIRQREANPLPAFTIDPTAIWETVRRLLDENDRSWRYTKNGDKRPWCDIDASVSARRRIRAEKQKAAVDRTLAEARARNLSRALPGQSIADRMLRAMQPGAWYGMGDIARMAGVDESGRAKVHQVLLRRGWVEKARNPAFRGILDPWQIMAGAEPEPLHLFRLSEFGLKVKAALPNEPPA